MYNFKKKFRNFNQKISKFFKEIKLNKEKLFFSNLNIRKRQFFREIIFEYMNVTFHDVPSLFKKNS